MLCLPKHIPSESFWQARLLAKDLRYYKTRENSLTIEIMHRFTAVSVAQILGFFLLVLEFIALWNETQDPHVDSKTEDPALRWATLQLTCAWNMRPVNLHSFIICSVSACDAGNAALCQHQNQTQYLYRLVVLCTTTLTSVFSLVWCKLSVSGILASRARRVVVIFFFFPLKS